MKMLDGYVIEKASVNDIDELESLYNDLIGFLNSGTNYPGWKREVYPTRGTAEAGIAGDSLFVLRTDGRIAGTVVLNHRPESVYDRVEWGIKADWQDVFVVHTLAVHPEYIKSGVAKKLLDFAKGYAAENGMKALRLDVAEQNVPAARLYEKCGYRCVGTLDFGPIFEYLGLKWYKLYEMNL